MRGERVTTGDVAATSCSLVTACFAPRSPGPRRAPPCRAAAPCSACTPSSCTYRRQLLSTRRAVSPRRTTRSATFSPVAPPPRTTTSYAWSRALLTSPPSCPVWSTGRHAGRPPRDVRRRPAASTPPGVVPADRAGRHRRRRDDGHLGHERVRRPAAGRRRADRRRLPGRGARGGRPLRGSPCWPPSTRSWPAGSPRAGRPSARHLLESVPWTRAPASGGDRAGRRRWRPWTAGWTRLVDGRRPRAGAAGASRTCRSLNPDARPLLRLRGRYVDESGRASAARDGPRARKLPVAVTFRASAVLYRMWSSYGHRSAAAVPVAGLRGAARSRTERGAGMPRARADVRADLEEVFRGRLPAGRRGRRPGTRIPRRGRGRRPGGVPLLRALLGAGRGGQRLAVRRRRPHRAEPAPFRAPPQPPGRRRPARPDRSRRMSPTVVTRDERRPRRAALARLPRRQAVALVLRHSGLSYAEVAAALDLSPGSVGTTVRRAESALRKELNSHASSD